MFHTREVVDHKDPASFSIEANKVLCSFSVMRALSGKREVDGKALVRYSCSASCMSTSGFFSLFCSEAGRTRVKKRMTVLKLRNTGDVFVCIKEVVVTRVTKMLMPKESFSVLTNGMYWCVLMDVFVEREGRKQ